MESKERSSEEQEMIDQITRIRDLIAEGRLNEATIAVRGLPVMAHRIDPDFEFDPLPENYRLDAESAEFVLEMFDGFLSKEQGK